ncbi:hypothetical protein PILCRDRAFT_508614 [Piloderma croceum F 1598]|uniref:Uncharacterized protein n=1 Tax=Piloderma croceum (strain F 1598) TaxID=765440 RepID=A0A0C3BUC3_PILCF|nr:hypothetical protein PILCRDRAFT_508614 [Piloderma croceum F 1598]
MGVFLFVLVYCELFPVVINNLHQTQPFIIYLHTCVVLPLMVRSRPGHPIHLHRNTTEM